MKDFKKSKLIKTNRIKILIGALSIFSIKCLIYVKPHFINDSIIKIKIILINIKIILIKIRRILTIIKMISITEKSV